MAHQTLIPLIGQRPNVLIILLHGVGANGSNMMPLARALHQSMPDAVIIAPDAPFDSDISQDGFQWFSVRGVSVTNRHERIEASTPALHTLINAALNEHGLSHQELALVGFSQGAMMALALADGAAPPFAIASIAGRIAKPVIQSRFSYPTIFLTHGDADPVVPFACLDEATRAFVGAGYATRSLVVDDLGHGINQRQVNAVTDFLASAFERKSLEVAL